ncbi:hypothetical protein G6F43_009356 [Rhizopus delemar]|nr:hypothetical protein G6F43_009356 [Rhizopus delemar]
MTDYHRSKMLNNSDRKGSDHSLKRDLSTTALLSHEQKLREEIAKLRREEQELKEKDHWVKQNIVALREKMAAERRHY